MQTSTAQGCISALVRMKSLSGANLDRHTLRDGRTAASEAVHLLLHVNKENMNGERRQRHKQYLQATNKSHNLVRFHMDQEPNAQF